MKLHTLQGNYIRPSRVVIPDLQTLPGTMVLYRGTVVHWSTRLHAGMAPISIGHGAVQHSIEGIQGYINANYFAPPAYWSQEIWAINAYVIAQGLDGLEPEAFNWRPRFIRMVTFSRVEGFVTTSMRGNQPLKTFKVWSAFPIHCECAG